MRTRGQNAKFLAKLMRKNDSPYWQKAHYGEIDGNIKQLIGIESICFYYFIMNEPLDVETRDFVASAPDDGTEYNYYSFPKIEFDANNIKNAIKENKKIVQIGEKQFIGADIINIVKVLGNKITFYQVPDALSRDVFESEEGIAVITPYRQAEGGQNETHY